MFTVCTHCHTRFRLSAAALTAAQGQVRCGKCHEVFDAYENLEGADVAPQMPPPPAEMEPMGDEAGSTADIALSVTGDAATPELGEQRKLRTTLQDVGGGLPGEQDAE